LKINNGREGEFLAASVIQGMNGWDVIHAGVQRIDLVAFCGETVVRVQVKSTLHPRRISTQYNGAICYDFLITGKIGGVKARRRLSRKDCDVIMLVALDKQVCRAMSVDDLHGKIHWRLPPDQFTPGEQTRTLKEVFDGCRSN